MLSKSCATTLLSIALLLDYTATQFVVHDPEINAIAMIHDCLTSFFAAMTSRASMKRTEGAAAIAASKMARIRSSDSPDVPPINSGPDAYISLAIIESLGLKF